MPNARFQETSSLGFHWSHFDPYITGSIVATPFSWGEALFRYSDVNDQLYSLLPEFSGDQSYKDKAFDAKFRIFKERKYLPQVAIGLRDFGGTGLYSSEFIAMSKYFNRFSTDFTMGIGWGVLGGGYNIKNPVTVLSPQFETRIGGSGFGGTIPIRSFFRGKKAGIFFGTETFIPKYDLTLKMELDSTDYNIEGNRPLPQKSKFNFSVNKHISKFFNLHLGYIKGDTLQFGFTLTRPVGNPKYALSKTDKHLPVENSEIVKRVASREDRLFYLALLQNLNQRNLYMQSADINDERDELHVTFSQTKYQSYLQSYGRVARVLNEISPNYINSFKITSLNSDFELSTIEIPRATLNLESKDSFQSSVTVVNNSKIYQEHKQSQNHKFRPEPKFPIVKTNIGPAVRSHIGGPDGFYFGQLWLRGDLRYTFNRNLSFTNIFGYGIYDTFSEIKLTSNSVLPHVRTDIVDYLKGSSGFHIIRSQVDYTLNPYKSIYTRLSAGIFEEMFAGYGGEILYRPFEKNYGIGIELFKAHQRQSNQLLDLRDYSTKTGFLNLYYQIPDTGVNIRVSGGRFLARDSGFQFSTYRRFKSGSELGIFFTLTDISYEEFGEGSFDKGFWFTIPLDVFFSNYSKSKIYYGLKPITRDGGARMLTGATLWGITDEGSLMNITRDRDDFFK